MKHILVFFLSVIVLAGFAHKASAELQLDLNKGVSEPLPLAISPFSAGDRGVSEFAVNMPQVIRNNLQSSGLFRAIDQQAYVQDANAIRTSGVNFGEWRAINAQGLITGHIERIDRDRLRVEFRLFDVFSQEQLIGSAFTTETSNWRRIAHIVSDEIYKRLTGEEGYFDSRIVYIAESGPAKNRRKRLAIMDQDGENHKFLTDGRNLVLTPRFSPTEQTITYMSFGRSGPRVYLYNITTGRNEVLGDFPGMTFAPRFSPDGRKVIMSQSINGNSDVYEMDLKSRKTRRLTQNSAIDTGPSYSPDGRQIVFESDRGGSQQLYILDVNGDKANRITFGKGRYANPVWSPRGDLIAFTRLYKGQFYIGVIRPDGSGERLITNAFHVEGPSWSPNGRVLTYFKEMPTGSRREGRSASVYTIDITGFNERRLGTPGDGSDPAWSPLN